ncbi:LuxR C-terminal-related transcriptional regulator [uncultured Aquimarina sp.]|uniref:LuxR C-terminal-related transcriptional regulator n=1 Tax=uncultured Aquimarina sp. TaxID=575652 RepID=UPI00262E83CD|nr:LuxR C-terminal-related transcriptional regulator [uncultured Aquimarina sp.]
MYTLLLKFKSLGFLPMKPIAITIIFLVLKVNLFSVLNLKSFSSKQDLYKPVSMTEDRIVFLKDSIANAEKLLIKDFGEFTAKGLRGLLRLSEKNGLFEETVNFNGALMFHYYRHKEYDSLYKYTMSLSNLLEFSNSNHQKNGNVILLHLHLAYILSKMYGYTPNVMKFYDKGYELSIKEEYYRGIIGIQIEKTELILRNHPTKEKVDQLLKETEQLINDHWKDNIRHNAIAGLMAKILLKQGKYEEAKQWATKSVDQHNDYEEGITSTLLSEIYYKEGHIEKAIQFVDKAIVCLKENIAYRDALSDAYYNKFKYLKSDDVNKAIGLLSKAIKTSPSIVDQIKYLNIAIEIMKENNGWDLVNDYKQKKRELLTIVYKADILNEGEFFVSKIDQIQLSGSNKILGGQLNRSKSIAVAMCFLMVSLLVLAFLIFKKVHFEKTKLAAIIPKQKKQLLQREDELRFVSMKLDNRVNRLKELKIIISKIKAVDPDLKKVKIELNGLIKSGEEFTQIGDRLLREYSGLAGILKDSHSFLTNTQIKYCILTKLGLSIKEIAEVMHVAPTTVKHAKSMIKKKIGFDSKLSLKRFLQLTFDDGQIELIKSENSML